jgi:hypothetical protein
LPTATAEQHVREFTRACVRSGLLAPDVLYAEVRQAVSGELPDRDPDMTARAWIDEFTAQLADDQTSWPAQTDYHRLQAAFADIEADGVVVLQGCDDHWAAKALLEQRGDEPPRGVAWFTPPDVWHAIDEGMLEVNLWHGNTANAAPGDPLLDEVLVIFERHELPAHFDEGRIEVSAQWHRPLA